MASNHSSLSVAELYTHIREVKTSLGMCLISFHYVCVGGDFVPGRQDEGTFHTLNVQFILISLLTGLAYLQETCSLIMWVCVVGGNWVVSECFCKMQDS